jgi:hypothetical protein
LSKDKEELAIIEHKWYIVFQDQKQNYMIAYGYEEKPIVMEFKGALEQFAKEPELKAAIQDFEQIIDLVCFDVMDHKAFVKYMEKQEKKAQKIEKKVEKSAKKEKKGK